MMTSLPSLLARGHIRSRRLLRFTLSFRAQYPPTPGIQRHLSNLSNNVAMQDSPFLQQGSTLGLGTSNDVREHNSQRLEGGDNSTMEALAAVEEDFRVSLISC
jgi:hypothetical protein